jgi:hypothetical protein
LGDRRPDGTVISNPATLAAARKDYEEKQKILQAGQSAITKENAKIVANSQDTENLIGHMDRVTRDITAGDTYFGSPASVVVGRGPVAQFVGSQLETAKSNNTKMALDTISKLATEGLKVLGSNPSEGDRKFWTENKPTISSSPEFVLDWVATRKADLQNRLRYAQQQSAGGGMAGPAAPVAPSTVISKTINGKTYIFDGKGWKAQ